MKMGNEGVFELGLLDVTNQPAHDPKTSVRFFRASDNKMIRKDSDLEFPPNKRFTLPAFPQEKNLFCEITPSRFRRGNTDFFTLTDGKVTRRNPIVLRSPDEWTPQFIPWNLLSGEFLRLQDALNTSPGIRVKKGMSFDRFVSETYDGVTDKRSVLAKMALLNLFAALTITREPTKGDASWFSFVKQIYLIDRERFIARVDAKMGEIIRAIKDDINKFKDYKHTNANNHFEGVQEAVPEGFKVLKSKMFSIKTVEEHANIQLTIAPTKDLDGNEVVVLDADIDENGRLLEHLADLIKHKITGGTHPTDIHEFLVLAHHKIALGYDLV
jgi:hypothetical protein